VIALEQTDEDTWVVPAVPPMATPPVTPAAPSVSIPETALPSLRDAVDAARARLDQEKLEPPVELAKLDPSKQEGQRQAEQQEAARQDAARQEAARAENVRLEAERREAERQEAARVAAAQQEAQRQEIARQQEAARVEAARREAARVAAAQQEAQRQEVARQEEAARVEAARREAERQQAARVRADQEEAEKREARLRAIGRQLDEEAAQREAASTGARLPTLPLSLDTARRVRLWGHTHPNNELVQYAEAWARKIQLNTAVETVREVAKQPHTAPLVWVAIRSDGSVESVTFDVSSGVAEVDRAIRRIVEDQKPYQAFPTALAREYDVIEIRRTWNFDTAVRLY
jgi:hypothetical protein